jgi:hypothetical protein
LLFHGFADYMRDYDVFMSLVADSALAGQRSRGLDLPFHEATIETNSHHISLVFADLLVDELTTGYAPFVLTD